MVKVAFVGCGDIQRIHCDQLHAMDDVTIVGHCDVEKGAANQAAETYGGTVYSDYESMYDKAKPDAVYVAVPPFAHNGMEEAAAERGIHLFIEKPIAVKRDQARRIAHAVRENGVLCSVGYCFRYADTVARARRMLKGKAVSLIQGCWNGGMPAASWWRAMDHSGGQIIEQTTHLFDLVRYLCGEVAEVYAAASTGAMTKVSGYDIHDSSAVTLRMKNGATGVVTSSCVSENGGRVALDIVTPEAVFTLEGGTLTVRENGRVTEYHPKVDMYEEENLAFIDAVRTGKKNKIRSSMHDAMKTFLVTAAANESIRTGLPVKP